MSKRDELIQYILNMTPEQIRKVLDHPEVIKMMKEHREQQANTQPTNLL